MTQQPATATATFDRLLRDLPATLARIRAGDDLAGLARVALAVLALSAAVFGAVLGAHRGGLQILYAAVKLPLVFLFTAALCAPALTALNAALGRRADLRRDLALLLVALARVGLVLAALVPLVRLAPAAGASYHMAVLLVVLACALAGLVGVFTLWRGLRLAAPDAAGLAAAGLLLVFSLVGAQMAWTLRPWLLRPRAPEPVFVRGLEGNFLDALGTTADSARGHYVRPEAPVPAPWPAEGRR